MVTLSLKIESELCGPVSIGTARVIKLLAQHLALPLPDAMTLVNRCVFDGETVLASATSREAALGLLDALARLPPVPRVTAKIIEN